MLCSEIVKINNIDFIKYYSDNYKKIQCVEDGNIYPSAYVAKDSTYSFKETEYSLNEISAFTSIEASNIIGLSDYIIETIDTMDGVSDDNVSIDLGGAS
jgi:hypothetical protein